jgi:hypothetical protein
MSSPALHPATCRESDVTRKYLEKKAQNASNLRESHVKPSAAISSLILWNATIVIFERKFRA